MKNSKTAQQNGKSYWNLDADGDPEKLEILKNQAMKNVLKIMQKSIQILVNSGDTQRLLILQACKNKLFQDAETAMKAGKKIKISDAGDENFN